MKRLIALVAMLSSTTLTACVYVQETHSHNKGTEVSQQLVAKVEPGKTTKEWVLINLGTPDRIHAEKDGLEVFEYVSEKREHYDRKFILLFSVESDKVVSKKVTRVVMRNGVVESVATQDA